MMGNDKQFEQREDCSRLQEFQFTEELLPTVFEYVPMAISFCDKEYNILNCNGEALRLFGLKSKREYSDLFFDLSPELQKDGYPSKEKALKYLSEAFEKGIQKFEWMHQNLENEQIPVEVTLVRLQHFRGEMVVSFARDLREHYEYVAMENSITERLQAMIDSSPLICSLIDRDLNILDTSIEAVHILKVSSKEEFKERFFELSPVTQPDGTPSRQKLKEKVNEVLESGVARFEWMHQTLDGEQVPTELYIERIQLEGEYYVFAHARDLREFYKLREMENSIKKRLQAMLDTSPLMCAIFDENINIVDANQAAADLLKVPDKETYINNFFDLAPMYQPDGAPSRRKAVEKLTETMKFGHTRFEWMHQASDGEQIPVEVYAERIVIDNSQLVITHARDLRDFYRHREVERRTKKRMKAMLDASPLACSIIDENYNVIDANQEAINLFELEDKQEYIDYFSMLSPALQPDGKSSREKMNDLMHEAFKNGKVHFEWLHHTLEYVPIPCEVYLTRARIDEKKVLIAHMRDLRELKSAVNMMRRMEEAAYIDPLTEAYNRRYFMEKATKELYSSNQNNHSFVIIMVDLDFFKKINDVFGHLAGDNVLKIAVSRMRHVVKQDTLIARYGGEEFILMLSSDTARQDAAAVAERIRESIEKDEFIFGNLKISVTASLGIAFKTNPSETLEDIISNADRALYAAKNAGRNTVMEFANLQ